MQTPMAVANTPRSNSLVQTLRWTFRPLPFMQECRQKFGSSFSLKFLGFERPMVLISDPAAIKAFFRGGGSAERKVIPLHPRRP